MFQISPQCTCGTPVASPGQWGMAGVKGQKYPDIQNKINVVQVAALAPLALLLLLKVRCDHLVVAHLN